MPRVTEATPDLAAKVHTQLAENFPPEATAWLDEADWSGPHPVPLQEVDTSNRDRWAASYGGPHAAWFWQAERQGGGVLLDLLCHGFEVAASCSPGRAGRAPRCGSDQPAAPWRR
jgi:hypothetical protein